MPSSPNSTLPTVLVLGGGLAGLAAASALAPLGFRVTLLESRNRLGGRAGSFHDSVTGQLIDACQHVTMGCCTNFAHFCRAIGVEQYLEPQPTLYFMTPDRRITRFRADDFPAPVHLARSFLTTHYLTWTDKLRIGYGLACMQHSANDADPPFRDWLNNHYQTQRTIDGFWGLVLVSALNETPDRIGFRYARKVFVDGFLTHPQGFEVSVPRVPLGELYGERMQMWFDQHHVELQFQKGAKHLHVHEGHVIGLTLRDGTEYKFDWYVSAVPFDRLLMMLPDEIVERHSYFANLKNLETSPITSVHLWYDRPVMHLPHVVLVNCVGQWIFNRGKTETGEYYVQVVVSAARQFRGLGKTEVERRVTAEMRDLFPEAEKAAMRRARVITEKAATFSAVPGVDRWRPPQESPLANLLVAGDWTSTGWPATMEGAVRSGYLAAEALLRKVGREVRLVRAGLG